jgi:hypothetical protein
VATPSVSDGRELEIWATSIASRAAAEASAGPVSRETLWSGIERAVTAAWFIDLVKRAAELIGPLIR